MGAVERRVLNERERFKQSDGSHPYNVPPDLGDEEFVQVVAPTFNVLLDEDRRVFETIAERVRQILQRVAAVI